MALGTTSGIARAEPLEAMGLQKWDSNGGSLASDDLKRENPNPKLSTYGLDYVVLWMKIVSHKEIICHLE
jgi:hypothetical protein